MYPIFTPSAPFKNILKYALPLIVVTHLCLTSAAQSQAIPFPSDSVHVNGCLQLRFQSQRGYAQPYVQVDLWCTFTSPTGKQYRIAGFWQKGSIYLVRFSPNEPGLWTYSTSNNYTNDAGLHQRIGSFHVFPYTGQNPVYAGGQLRVADSKRVLAYEDGTPFYYLADTPWEIGWKSSIDDVQRFLHNRKQKGFTAIQCVTLSHQIMNYWGMINMSGSSAFEDSSYTEPHARYFDYIDSLLTAINDSGMVVVMSPLWAGFAEPHNVIWKYRMRHDVAMRWARYMAARYAGHNVVWIIAGDDLIDTPEKVSFWNDFAMQIKDAGSWRQLCTSHPNGGSASFTYFTPDTPWLDFQMYHSSHSDNNSVTYDRALEGWVLDPVKPIVNGEPAFEDIYDVFWETNDTNLYRFWRLDAQNVRFAHYTSILSGAIGGTAYGADGVFQWSIPTDTGSHYARYILEDAWALPGSSNMTIMRRFMEEIRWYNLSPRLDLLEEWTSKYHVSVAATDSLTVAYLPKLCRSITLTSLYNPDSTVYHWFNPRTGEMSGKLFILPSSGGAEFTLAPPDTNDWIVVVRKMVNADALNMDEPPASVAGMDIYPNPCHGRGWLRFDVDTISRVGISVHDRLGRELRRYAFSAQPGAVLRELQLPYPGVFLVRLTVLPSGSDGRTYTRKILSY